MCGLGWAGSASAQGARYTLAVRGQSLAQALETFVEATGVSLGYDPDLVRGRTAYCAIEQAAVEDVLRCLLYGTGLDFFRLSSGTYVLVDRTEVRSLRGNLAGIVRDGDTGTPLADAHVFLHNAGIGSVTNRAGQFTFPSLLPGRYAVSVSYLGYETWRDTLDVAPEMATRAEARLTPTPILITPVVVDGLQQRDVSASLGSGRVEAGDGDAGAVSGLLRSALHPLGTLPGVHVHDVTAGVHLQGGASGAHQFRLDGVPVFLPRHLVGFVGPFNSFALDRITVHKAGFGAALGSHSAGVVEATHAVDGLHAFDVQLDPLSVNGRVRHRIGTTDGPHTAFMAAARVGLWGMHQPAPLRAMLDAWTRPDLFLVLAPLAHTNALEPTRSMLEGLPGLIGPSLPDLAFSDVHAAARFRPGPMRTLHASLYHGRSSLEGGVLARALDGFGTEMTPTFTVVDGYEWDNLLGQIRYDAVLGSRTLFSAYARGSRYELSHRYQILDTLLVTERPTLPPAVTSLATVHVRDGNRIALASAGADLDHALGRHHLRAGLELTRIDSRFNLLSVNLPIAPPTPVGHTDERTYAGPDFEPVHNQAGQWLAAAYSEDVVALSRHWTAEAGVRITYRPERATLYAEPRLALRHDGELAGVGPWSMRTALGLYRQFINEFDVSKLNAGALLPEIRVWLPLDQSVRPPLTYHVAQSFLLAPGGGWTLRAEGFYKYEPHGLALRYQAPMLTGASGAVRAQSQILATTRGHAYGTAATAEWEGRHGRVTGLYEYSHAVRRSPHFFDGRTETVPWNEPHRVELTAQWTPTSRLALTARWQGVWGRAWGFRRAYYDYLAHTPSTRFHDPYDLGRPSDHVLSALLQLDLGAAYTLAAGPARLQFRLDVRNALDRDNVADWSLDLTDTGARRVPRLLYPRMPSFAVRLSY